MARELLTPVEVAAEIGVCRQTIMRKLRSGELRGINVGGAGRGARWRVSVIDLAAWLEENRRAAP